MNKSNKFSPEVRERAVRMVFENRGEYPPCGQPLNPLRPKTGCVAQALHDWVRKHEIDTGRRNGVTSTVSG
jgi:transposase-like protein